MQEKRGYCAGSLDVVHIRDCRSCTRNIADASMATVAADIHVYYRLVATEGVHKLFYGTTLGLRRASLYIPLAPWGSEKVNVREERHDLEWQGTQPPHVIYTA